MVSYIISRLVVLVFGTLYPAYASYKAVKTRNVKEYVKWMMYWIVFALFTFVETVVDIFASLLPFYYEAKILFIFWLISPWTKGSTYLYRKFIHPTLSKREQEIDEYISQASNKGYEALKKVSKDGFTIAANVVMTSAMKGQTTLMDQLKNYSKMSAKNTIQEEDEGHSEQVEKDGGEGNKDTEDMAERKKEMEYDRPLRERIGGDPDMSPSLQDSLHSLDNRLREEQDIRYSSRIEDQDPEIDPDYGEDERVIHRRKNKPDPSPRRAVVSQYYDRHEQEEYDNDAMYLPEDDDYALRRTPSLRSLKEPLYMSPGVAGMSRSHYASADNLGRRPMRRKQEVQPAPPSTERAQGRYGLRTTGIKMTSKKQKKNKTASKIPQTESQKV